MANEFDADLLPPGRGPGILAGLPERAFVVAIQHGMDYIKANPSLWDAILRHADTVERAAAKEAFGTGGIYENMPIRTGFPLAAMDAPQVTVTVEDEARGERVLGDHTGELDDDLLGGAGGEQRGEFRAQTLAVTICAGHPDIVLYLYRAIDSILIALSDWFLRPMPDGAGFTACEWMSGAPVIPDAQGPERLWGRQIRWQVSGLAGTILRIPPPKNKISLHVEGVIVAGLPGGLRAG